MPWPTDNKVAGTSTGMTSDLNFLWGWGAGQPYNVQQSDYGAVGNGSHDDTSAIQGAIDDALTAGGGVVFIPPGTYKTTSTITAQLSGKGLKIMAPAAATLSYYGSGDCLRFYDSSAPSGRTRANWSGIYGLNIDGGNASSGAVGLHAGDIQRLRVDEVVVRSFDGTGAKGIWFDNSVYWTENMQVRAFVSGCSTGVVFEQTNGTNSFARADCWLQIEQGNIANDGVTLRGGALMYQSRLHIVGNFKVGTPAPSSAVLRIADNLSEKCWGELFIGVESGPSQSNYYGPHTILFGQANNKIDNEIGNLDFATWGNGFQASNNSGNVVNFVGNIRGDATL